MARRGRKVAWVKAALLAYGIVRGEFYGYEAYKMFMEAGGQRWRPSIGTIYKTLAEMVEEGLLSRRSVRRTPRRTVHLYSVTDKGIEAYLEKALDYADKTAFWLALVVGSLARLEERGFRTPANIVEKLGRLCRAASRLSKLQESSSETSGGGE